MRTVIGASALGYVVLAAIENMGLLGMPGLGAAPAEVRAAYADPALGVVTTAAGALSLLCYVVFAGLLHRRRLPEAVTGAALAAGGVAVAAVLVGGGDPALFDLQLVLRYLAGPFMALFLLGAAGELPPPLRTVARVVAAGLMLSPVALTGFELAGQLAFAAHAAVVWAAALWLLAGGRDLLLRGAYLMLVVAAGLVGVAMLAVPEATGAFFAWSLAPAPVAAFAGGVYVGSAALYAVGLRAADTRGLTLAAVVLSVSVLTATVAHLDVFDLGRLQAWAWLGLFGAFALVTTRLAATASYTRADGPRLPWPAGLAFAAAATGLGAAALALWIDPAAFSLPPLGGRFAGSWAAMLAALAGWAVLRDRRDEARLPALALVLLPAGALLAAARTGADPGYVAALVALLLCGAVSAAPDVAARTARAGRARAPRRSPARPIPGRTAPTR